MRTTLTSRKDLLYLRIARNIEQKILNEVLKVGDKLPSIRMICREHGVSMSTAQFAYHELEKKSLIESRPQSGYYVSDSFRRKLAIPETSRPSWRTPVRKISEVFASVYNNATDPSFTMFSMGIPSEQLLPLAKLRKSLAGSVRGLPGEGTQYQPVAGNERLRRQIARWSFSWNGNLAEDDLVVTNGCMNALAYCMMTIAKAGDTVAVESPCFFGILQLAQSLGLKVLELPTHPKTGVELEALKKAVIHNKIRFCLLVSNFSNPLGSCMPDEHKKEAVALLEQYGVPLIEDDLYGDIYFGDHRPTCCKTYDESGNVLWCSSVSKTLAPGYRVGWVAPGKFKEKIVQMKLFHSLSSPTLTSEIVADFLENGRYESHLRKLRRALHTNYLHYVRVIGESFPEQTRISRPQGGLSLWTELPASVNTLELYNLALRQKISIAPGMMFSLQHQFDQCMRLSFGIPWNAKTESSLKILGKMVKSMS